MKSIKNQILKYIKAQDINWVFSACDFINIASQAVVNDALAVLASRNDIRRLSKGLYDVPHWSQIMKKYAAPDPDQIIKALARKNNYPILMDGLNAANSLGLTNAVPVQNVYFSDINPTTFTIAGWKFRFRKAGKKRIYWAGRKGGRTIQALWWLGKDILKKNKNQIVNQLKSILPSDVKKDLLNGLKLKKTPSWMNDAIRDIVHSS